jgi:hypothetical protein
VEDVTIGQTIFMNRGIGAVEILPTRLFNPAKFNPREYLGITMRGNGFDGAVRPQANPCTVMQDVDIVVPGDGNGDFVDFTGLFPFAGSLNEALHPTSLAIQIRADRPGYLARVDAEAIGRASVALGAGRVKKGDPVDPAVGIVFAPKIGDEVEEGQVLGEVHARDEDAAALRSSLLTTAAATDFAEYVDPWTGQGLGARSFSWTAATVLDLLAQE